MGQRYSQYFSSSDEALHVANDNVGASQTREYYTKHDNTVSQTSASVITADDQHRQSNAVLASADSVNTVQNAGDTSVSAASVCTPISSAVTSSQAKEQCQPWFFANMTEEHWERLNVMCIVSPSSS